MIAKKYHDVFVFHPQLRRYRCGNCNAPFTLLWPGEYATRVQGFRLIESDERMREVALSKAAKALRKAIAKRRVGLGRCPSCNATQGWMTLAAYARSISDDVQVWSLLGLFPAAGLYGFGLYDDVPVLLSMIAVALLLGLGFGLRNARRLTTGPKGDPRTRTDAELNRHLRRCRTEGVDPILTWVDEIPDLEIFEQSLVVPLGLCDEFGGYPVPPELRPEAVLAVLDGPPR